METISRPQDMLAQMIQLYELSLAVGHSTTLAGNCRYFFGGLLAKRKLHFAGLWLLDDSNPAKYEFQLMFQEPVSRYHGPEALDINHPLVQEIEQRKSFCTSRSELEQQLDDITQYLPSGDSFIFFHLDQLGFVLLAGEGDKALWPDWQVGQMKPILNRFAESIRSNLYFEHLQDEIHQRKNAELQAVQSKELKERFLANMSHELRTPLNAVLGMSQLLEDTDLDSEQMELVDTILKSGQSLLALINDILDLSKLEAGKVSLEKIHFSIDEIIDVVAKTFARDIETKGLKFEIIETDLSARFLLGDPFRIRQVLNNLLGNALKFTERGGITLEIKQLKGSGKSKKVRVEFRVIDTGIGMEAPGQAEVFESFQQGDASITRRFGGTGLGLSISKQLVQLMQGEFGVSSRVNEGSEFFFQIPLTRSAPGKSRKVESSEPQYRMPVDSARILLVEDDSFNQLVAIKLLEKLGFSCDVVENGQKAVDLLEQIEYDLVFMDVQMPVMGGLEATRLIRNASSAMNRDITIIAMTANAMESDRHLCLQAGMNDFLAKPIDKEQMADKLEIWLMDDTGYTHPETTE